jgi:hypothetical protein
MKRFLIAAAAVLGLAAGEARANGQVLLSGQCGGPVAFATFATAPVVIAQPAFLQFQTFATPIIASPVVGFHSFAVARPVVGFSTFAVVPRFGFAHPFIGGRAFFSKRTVIRFR